MTTGGAETLFLNVLRSMDKNLIQMDFLVLDESKGFYDDEIISLGSKIYYLGKFKSHKFLNYRKKWDTIFKDLNYDIIHNHLLSHTFFISNSIRNFDTKLIVHSHSDIFGGLIKGLIVKLSLIFSKKNIDKYLAVSEYSGKRVFGKAFSKYQSEILLSSIDYKAFFFDFEIRNVLHRLYYLENKTVIGNVARFHKVKNHKFLIRLFKNLSEKNHDLHLVLIGSGPNKTKIKKLINHFKLEDKILILDSKKNINEYYNIFDLFILPSLHEGIPLTLIEAQYNGLEIIASDKINRRVNFTNNITFIPLKIDIFTEITQKKLNKIKGVNRKTVDLKNKHFSLDTYTKKIIKIYQELESIK